MATLVIVLALAAYTYLKKFNPLLVIAVAAAIILFWLVTFLLKKYLDVTIKSTNEQLQKKLLSS
jgi:capsular polysaccharide biosynthesis protein